MTDGTPAAGPDIRLLFSGLAASALLNALVGPVLTTGSDEGWLVAIGEVLDRKTVVLLAVGLAVVLVARRRDRVAHPARPTDLVMALGASLLILLPHSAGGWLALGLLGTYGMIAWRRDARLAASAVIVLAVCMHELGGRALSLVAAPYMMVAEAALAAAVLEAAGVPVGVTGNIIHTGRGFDLVVNEECLALRGILQAILVHVFFTRVFRPTWHPSEALHWPALMLSVALINTGRLAFYALDQSHLEIWHTGPGSMVFEFGILMLALSFAAYGVLRDPPGKTALELHGPSDRPRPRA